MFKKVGKEKEIIVDENLFQIGNFGNDRKRGFWEGRVWNWGLKEREGFVTLNL